MEYYIELIRKKIGLNIKRLRSSNGYSRKEFAKKIKISESKLTVIENGEINYSFRYLIKIGRELDPGMKNLLKV
jgi:transcriptional regulator with XRE-family HTH domain